MARLPGVLRALFLAVCVTTCSSEPNAVVTVEVVEVSPGTFAIAIGEERQLTATPKAGGVALSGRTITWSTSSATIATVDQTGLVRGAGAGTAQITATSEQKSGSAEATVNNPAPQALSLVPATIPAGSAAFTLVVTGSQFVNGSVVRWNGVARTTTFNSATQLSAQITAADVAVPGSAQVTVFTGGPGGGASASLAFETTAIPNPVPVLTLIAPDNAVAGSTAFIIAVTGTGFVSTSQIKWNGSGRTTTFNSATQLTAQITAGDIATAGVAQVTVFTPSPGGGTSAQRPFTIVQPNPVPAISSLTPANAVAGGPGFSLIVNGSNFVNGSAVRWNGVARATTFNSAAQLTAQILAADIAAVGVAQVTVFTPAPGGGTSNASVFNILPTIGTTIIVNTVQDETGNPVLCSLRAAVQSANSNLAVNACAAGSALAADKIVFATGLSSAVTLGSALPNISAALQIDGENRIDLIGGAAIRHFVVNAGVNLTIDRMTLRNGGSSTSAGSILNNGTLALTNCTLRNNGSTSFGGAIVNNPGATLTISNCTINNNGAGASGGAIVNVGGATIVITGSTFFGHGAGTFGGTISNDGSLSITTSTFRNNSANNHGGGVYHFGGTLTITRSAFYSNNVGSGGGGLYVNAGSATISNSTFSANVAGGAGGFFGGGIGVLTGTTSLINVTVTDNSAGPGDGGIHAAVGATVNLRNSIIAGQPGGTPNCAGTTASFVSGGNNLSFDATCNLVAAGDRPLTPANLGLLADNGGPTLTHALNAGSLAINGGSNVACAAAPISGIDQRGFARSDGQCDIGAYEFVSMLEEVARPFANGSVSLALRPLRTPRFFFTTEDAEGSQRTRRIRRGD